MIENAERPTEEICPHCHLPAVLPEACTPTLYDAIEAQVTRDWEVFEAGRQHGIAYPPQGVMNGNRD
jgi:hypothetical protein